MARIKRYTPQEKAVYNEQKQAEINNLIKRIDEGVQTVFKSERFKEYLKFASMFTDYSARNTMLINLQKPHATFVASYGKWKKLGRQVERGEKGIVIFAPVTYETNQYSEVQVPVLDKQGNPLFNEDGTTKIQTIERPLTGLSFKKAYVYDVSQTSGKGIPTLADELAGDIDVEKKEAIFRALKRVMGIDFEFRDLKSDVKGFYNHAEDRIVIKSGMSDAQTLKTAFHETAHKLLHDPKLEIVTVKALRNEKEVQAESVAFMVAERLGLDTSEYSFPYIASWSDGKQMEQLRDCLQEIHSAAKQIGNEIEMELWKLHDAEMSRNEYLAG